MQIIKTTSTMLKCESFVCASELFKSDRNLASLRLLDNIDRDSTTEYSRERTGTIGIEKWISFVERGNFGNYYSDSTYVPVKLTAIQR